MNEEVHATAHGKILWLGGYSILERPNLGYVTTVDAGIHAFVRKSNDNKVTISVPHFHTKVIGKLDQKSGNIDINVPEELRLIKTAIEITLMYLSGKGNKISGINIRTLNDPSFSYKINKKNSKISKVGLGSSAAVTVATIAGILNSFDVDPHADEALHKLSQIAHSVASGKVGSGYDIAAATYGDIVYTRYSPEIIQTFPKNFNKNDVIKIVKKKWDYTWMRLPLPQLFEIGLAKFIDAAAITKSMIGGMNQFKSKYPEEYNLLIEQINKENLSAISALERINKNIELEENLNMFKSSFNNSRILTKELGEKSGVATEPNDATNLVEKTIEKGAFAAKLPGAGGYDCVAAIFLKENNGSNGNYIKKVLKFWGEQSSIHVVNIKKFDEGFEIKKKGVAIINAK